ncbi:hypothetical protein ACA910_019489 [Epithemia clementina (nom. ined.)]
MSFEDMAAINAILTAAYTIAACHANTDDKSQMACCGAVDNGISAFYSSKSLGGLTDDTINSAINDVRNSTLAKVDEVTALAATADIADAVGSSTLAIATVTEAVPLVSAIFFTISAISFLTEAIDLAIEKAKAQDDVTYINAIGDHIKAKAELAIANEYVDSMDKMLGQASNMGIDHASAHATIFSAINIILGTPGRDSNLKVSDDEVFAQLETLALINSAKVPESERQLFIQSMAEAKAETDEMKQADMIAACVKIISGWGIAGAAAVTIISSAMAMKMGGMWFNMRAQAMRGEGYLALDDEAKQIEDPAEIGAAEDVAITSRWANCVSITVKLIRVAVVLGGAIQAISDIFAAKEAIEGGQKMKEQVNTYADAYIDFYKTLAANQRN